jgi:hypothetical protein
MEELVGEAITGAIELGLAAVDFDDNDKKRKPWGCIIAVILIVGSIITACIIYL